MLSLIPLTDIKGTTKTGRSHHLCNNVLYLQDHVSTGHTQRSLPRVVKAWETQLTKKLLKSRCLLHKIWNSGEYFISLKKRKAGFQKTRVYLHHRRQNQDQGLAISNVPFLATSFLLPTPLILSISLTSALCSPRSSHPLASPQSSIFTSALISYLNDSQPSYP